MKLEKDLNSTSGVELAIQQLNGKAYALANLCGVSQQAVSLWRKKESSLRNESIAFRGFSEYRAKS